MTPLPLSSQTLAWLNHAADAGQRDAQVLLHLIARADAQDQWFAKFTDSYSRTIAALCRRLEALERGANDLTAAPDPVEPEIEVCETCDGEGTIDERLGGISTSNPAATCPDCDGVGEPRRFHRHPPAGPVPAPEADPSHIDQLAAIIRRVDGNNSMGAAALAEAILERYPLAFLVDPPATQPALEPPSPSGYAYRYRSPFGGTCIRFNGGEEVNGGRPIEPVPYWFAPPSAPATPPAPKLGEVGELVEMLTQEAAILEAHCNKIANGECRTLACLQRGGYIRGTESPDSSVATCPELEKAVAKRRAATLLQQEEAELAALQVAPGPTFQDAIHLAEGCHDYSGGHSGAEGEAWHGAISTIVDVLKRAAVGAWDSQTRAVYGVGAEAQAGELAVPEPVSECPHCGYEGEMVPAPLAGEVEA
jgi:hypothetical protein